MGLDETFNIKALIDELTLLRKRSKLLSNILEKYDPETMTFIVPEKWKSHKVDPSRLPAESPRHHLKNKICDTLSEDERYYYRIYD